MTEGELDEVLANYDARYSGRIRTHSDVCWKWADHAECTVPALVAELKRVKAAVTKHHSQKADDRCHFDDDELYTAFGLPPADKRVGDKVAMIKSCEAFLDRRCEGGHWPSYAELATELLKVKGENARLRELVDHCWVHSAYRDCGSEQMTTEMREFFMSVIDQEILKCNSPNG